MSRGGNAQQRRRARRAANRGVVLGLRNAQDQASEHGPITLDADTLATITEIVAAASEKEACSACGHAEMSHDGDSCSIKGCSCSGYEVAQTETSAVSTIAATSEAVTATSGEFTFTFTNVTGLSDAEIGEMVRTGIAEYDTLPFDEAVTADGAVEMELPDEHQVGEHQPRRRSTPKAPDATIDRNAQLKWTAKLAPEGKATDDGRIFAPGSITWRELPLSLMAMTQTADGHDGAEIAGRIDRIWRDEDAGLIRASGVFDSGDFGRDIARLVNDGTLRGVSVDLAPQKVDVAYRSEVVDEDGVWLDDQPEESVREPNLLDLFLGESDEPIIYVVREAVLGMATVCPFQAFADATIESDSSLVAAASPMIWTLTAQAGWTVTAGAVTLTASAEFEDGWHNVAEPVSVTASAAGIAPALPPADWFDEPEFAELTALTVDEDGRVFGHAAAWATCHIGLPGGCRTAPHSITNYSYFHLKEIECDDGSRVSCGTITLDANHARQDLGRADAAAHYDHTGTAVADVIVGEDDYGIWVSGALRADVDADKARKLRGAVLSGDWRNVNGNLELVALLAVNVPGFPVPRTKASLVASADDETWEPQSLVAAGIHNGIAGLTDEQKAQVEVLAAQARGDFAEFTDLA